MTSSEYAPYVHNCYPIAVRSVRDAITVDQANDFKDAYRRYLACILSMIHALKDEAWDRNDLAEMGHVEAIKLLRLSDQCLSRASDILKEASQKHVIRSPDKASAARRYSQPPSPVSSNFCNRPMTNRSASFDSSAANISQAKDYSTTIMALPTPPGYSQIPQVSTSLTPSSSSQTYSSRYVAHTKAINEAYQRRKTLRNESSIMQKYATANHNLSQLRKEAEMMAISKAKEKAHNNKIMERQKKMHLEAERRWNARRSHLQRDKSYRQNLLACILIFEEDQPWTKVLRQSLKQNKEKNEIIVSIVKAVLLNVNHPLHRVMIEIQQNLFQKLAPLVREFADSTNLELPDNVYLEPVNEQNSTYNTYYEQRYVDTPLRPNQSTPPVSNIPEAPQNIIKTEEIPDPKTEKHHEPSTWEVKETFRGARVTSLETAFNDMEDEMFSSDLEEDGDENAENESETEKTNVENEQADTDDKISDIDADYDNPSALKSRDENNANVSENEDGNYECSLCSNTSKDGLAEGRESLNSVDENDYKVLTLTPSTNQFFYKQTEEKNDPSDYEDLNTTLNTSDYEQLCEPENPETEEKNNPAAANMMNKNRIPKIVEPIYEEIDNLDSGNKSSDVPPAASVKSTRRLSAHSIGSDMASLIDTEFLKDLDNIVQELLHGIDRLHSVLLLTYEDMDTPMGKDQSYAVLESLFFKPLWPWLIAMFRKINWHKEKLFEHNITKYADVTPQQMKIREKFWLTDDENSSSTSYQTAIDEMKHLTSFSCPLEKLECIVRTSRLICIEVEAYWNAKGDDKPPALGCDDLLPIFSYVVLKTQLSQIVAECHAMEEFIHEGYLLGEEGYCLTTLHAAISYLLTLE